MRAPYIFSLTDAGASLAQRLLLQYPTAQHRHRPGAFIEVARQVFTDQHPCIFICSTGIVIRALAPVLRDKYLDPPVIALDEQGEYVIPLLSGHEGGAYEWGRQIADAINAQLVMTAATDYSRPVYCIGLGSDKGCPAPLISALFQEAKAHPRLPTTQITFALVASISLKQKEAGMLSFAESLSLPFQCFPADQLRAVEDQLSIRSDIVFREVGCYGVAEAAALLGASSLTGNPAELVVPKLKNTRATIAIARSYR